MNAQINFQKTGLDPAYQEKKNNFHIYGMRIYVEKHLA